MAIDSIRRAELRSYATILLLAALLTLMGVFTFFAWRGRFEITGQWDAAIILGAFISSVNIALGWLFGRQNPKT